MDNKFPIIAYFSGPVGSGRFQLLVNYVAELYKPGLSQVSQLQDILSDYPQIVWFSGSRMFVVQNEKNVNQIAPQLIKYSHFEVYNLAKLDNYLINYKNLLIVMDESCITPQPGVIAGRAKEMQKIMNLVQKLKVSLLVEGSQMPMAVQYGAQVGFAWDKDNFILKKNLPRVESDSE